MKYGTPVRIMLLSAQVKNVKGHELVNKSDRTRQTDDLSLSSAQCSTGTSPYRVPEPDVIMTLWQMKRRGGVSSRPNDSRFWSMWCEGEESGRLQDLKRRRWRKRALGNTDILSVTFYSGAYIAHNRRNNCTKLRNQFIFCFVSHKHKAYA